MSQNPVLQNVSFWPDPADAAFAKATFSLLEHFSKCTASTCSTTNKVNLVVFIPIFLTSNFSS